MKYVHLCSASYCKEYGLPYPCTDSECDNVELEAELLPCHLCGNGSPFMEDSDELNAKREWIETDDGPILEKNGERWHVMAWGTTEWYDRQVNEVWCERCLTEYDAGGRRCRLCDLKIGKKEDEKTDGYCYACERKEAESSEQDLKLVREGLYP